MRLKHIDVFKGVCIFLVVIHHIPFVFNNVTLGTEIWGITWIQNFIMGFFMPAFIIATGLCTNFSSPFKLFVLKNIKTILLPCYCLYYINHFLACINDICFTDANWVTWSHFFSPGLRTFFQEGGYFWFLPALFLSKNVYYIIARFINNVYFRCLASLILSVCGVICAELWPKYNYFFWQHGLILLVFLPVGEFFKKNEMYIFRAMTGGLSLLLYICIISTFTLLQINVPSVTRTIDVDLTSYLLFVLLAIVGSLGVLWICFGIKQCNILEYFGKNSIVIYTLNYIISVFVVNTLLRSASHFFAIHVNLLFVIVTVLDLLLLSALSWILNRRFTRVLLGKF